MLWCVAGGPGPSLLVTLVSLRKERLPQSVQTPSLPLPLLHLLHWKTQGLRLKSCCASKHLTWEGGVIFQTWCRFFFRLDWIHPPLGSFLIVLDHSYCLWSLLYTILEHSLIDIQMIVNRDKNHFSYVFKIMISYYVCYHAACISHSAVFLAML